MIINAIAFVVLFRQLEYWSYSAAFRKMTRADLPLSAKVWYRGTYNIELTHCVVFQCSASDLQTFARQYSDGTELENWPRIPRKVSIDSLKKTEHFYEMYGTMRNNISLLRQHVDYFSNGRYDVESIRDGSYWDGRQVGFVSLT